MIEGIRCCLAAIPISEAVELIEKGGVGSQLSRSEQQEVSGRHPQTLAGVLAAKDALCELHSSDNERCERRDFVIHIEKNHAPELVGISSRVSGEKKERFLKKTKISISHTRHWAYGMVAFDQERP